MRLKYEPSSEPGTRTYSRGQDRRTTAIPSTRPSRIRRGVLDTPFDVLDTLRAVLDTPHAVLVTPRAVLDTLRDVLGTQVHERAVAGQIDGQPRPRAHGVCPTHHGVCPTRHGVCEIRHGGCLTHQRVCPEHRYANVQSQSRGRSTDNRDPEHKSKQEFRKMKHAVEQVLPLSSSSSLLLPSLEFSDTHSL